MSLLSPPALISEVQCLILKDFGHLSHLSQLCPLPETCAPLACILVVQSEKWEKVFILHKHCSAITETSFCCQRFYHSPKCSIIQAPRRKKQQLYSRVCYQHCFHHRYKIQHHVCFQKKKKPNQANQTKPSKDPHPLKKNKSHNGTSALE